MKKLYLQTIRLIEGLNEIDIANEIKEKTASLQADGYIVGLNPVIVYNAMSVSIYYIIVLEKDKKPTQIF